MPGTTTNIMHNKKKIQVKTTIVSFKVPMIDRQVLTNRMTRFFFLHSKVNLHIRLTYKNCI